MRQPRPKPMFNASPQFSHSSLVLCILALLSTFRICAHLCRKTERACYLKHKVGTGTEDHGYSVLGYNKQDSWLGVTKQDSKHRIYLNVMLAGRVQKKKAYAHAGI